MLLSDKIKNACDRRNLTRKEAALQMGVSYPTLCLVAKGYAPGAKIRRKIDAWLYGKPKPNTQKEQPHVKERTRDSATA